MHINIVTLFPEWFTSPLETALLGKAKQSGLISITLVNPRKWATDRHSTVDDRPYGGGPGMVMKIEPLVCALNHLNNQPHGYGRVLMLSASGKPFKQKLAQQFVKEPCLTFICGRYEGIDSRILDLFPIESINVSDAVFNGGEVAAMMVLEATTRLIPGFMGKEDSWTEDSFSNGLLEHPHYTRPEVYRELHVPKVLLEGNHKNINQWRREASLKTTFHSRPSMLNETVLSISDMNFLNNANKLKREGLGRNLHCALLHYPVLLKDKKVGVTSLTNLDIHDIARCSKTYGLASVTMITPLQDQQNILKTIITHWTVGSGSKSNPDRAEALKLVNIASTLEEAITTVEKHTGQVPILVGTSASNCGMLLPSKVKKLLLEQPVILLFGTGHGIAQEILDMCTGVLRPLRWMNAYNHLPVRSAVAITLDRILGDFN